MYEAQYVLALEQKVEDNRLRSYNNFLGAKYHAEIAAARLKYIEQLEAAIDNALLASTELPATVFFELRDVLSKKPA